MKPLGRIPRLQAVLANRSWYLAHSAARRKSFNHAFQRSNETKSKNRGDGRIVCESGAKCQRYFWHMTSSSIERLAGDDTFAPTNLKISIHTWWRDRNWTPLNYISHKGPRHFIYKHFNDIFRRTIPTSKPPETQTHPHPGGKVLIMIE